MACQLCLTPGWKLTYLAPNHKRDEIIAVLVSHKPCYKTKAYYCKYMKMGLPSLEP